MGRLTLRRARVAGIGAGLLALSAAGVTPSLAADQTSIYIVQGLPSRTLSFAVDGHEVVADLAGATVAGPLPVKSGRRTVTVTDGDQTVLTSKVALAAGSSSEIVVHLPASPDGEPVLTRFDNDAEPVQRGRGAYAVAHVAAAGPVDIRVGGAVVLANVATGEYVHKVVPAEDYSVDLVATGQSDPLLGPVDVTIAPGRLTWLYAIGEPGKDLALVRHVVALPDTEGSKPPTRVDTGTGGQAAELARNGPAATATSR